MNFLLPIHLSPTQSARGFSFTVTSAPAAREAGISLEICAPAHSTHPGLTTAFFSYDAEDFPRFGLSLIATFATCITPRPRSLRQKSNIPPSLSCAASPSLISCVHSLQELPVERFRPTHNLHRWGQRPPRLTRGPPDCPDPLASIPTPISYARVESKIHQDDSVGQL